MSGKIFGQFVGEETLPKVNIASRTSPTAKTYGTMTNRDMPKRKRFNEVRLLLLSGVFVGILLILWLVFISSSLQPTFNDASKVSTASLI